MPTLDFKGKNHIYAHHLTVPYRPLQLDESRSVLPASSNGDIPLTDQNLIIHGDNLHALKALLPHYAGRVKCIYIDPPYNTGNEGWVYNDKVNSPLMREWLEKHSPVDGEDLERHDKWLCMMWPRLHLLRELLRDDGVIFVSIDDNEVHHLRMMMDEVFGEENHVASFVWEGTGKNDARFVSVGHDYVLCYARDILTLRSDNRRWRARKEGIFEIQKFVDETIESCNSNFECVSEKLKAWYSSLSKNHPSWAHRHYNWVDERGIYFAGDISWPGGGGPRYKVLHPITEKEVRIPKGGWRFSKQETMLQAICDDRIHFGANEGSVPKIKRYLSDTRGQVLASVIYKDRRAAHQRLSKIFDDTILEYPKDETILQLLIAVATNPSDIILDSFAGSGTTAHAVLALNKKDGGNRRFILVECEDYADSITAERVRRVIRGVPNAKDKQLREGLGGAFAYCTLGDAIDVDSLLEGDTLPSYSDLASYLLHTATGISASSTDLNASDADGHFYSSDSQDYYLIYESSVEFLRSGNAALNLERAERIRDKGRSAVVFAAADYIGQRQLSQWDITFCQLPYELGFGG